MNENIFDKRRLKIFSNCKDLVRSMVGTRDGVIVYNEKFRLDLENTCYKASICEDLQKKLEQLKEEKRKVRDYINKHCVNEKISKEVGYKCYTMADTNELEKIMKILGDK